MTKLQAICYYSLKGENYIRTKTYSRRFEGTAEDVDKAVIEKQVEAALHGELAWKLGDKPFEIKNIMLNLIQEIW